MKILNLTIPTLLGTESIVANEVRKLGYETTSVTDGRVNFTGDFEAVCLANINLRCAERIMIHMADFHAESFEELFVGVGKIPWENYIGKNDAFPVAGHCLKSQLHSVPDCQAIIKKSIVKRLASVYGISHFEETNAKFPIHFAIMKNTVSIYIDTSGENLYKRGYREKAVIAPMRETLGYAMVDMSFWRGDRPFCDPFCGSGTIPIEAAMYACNIAPGLKRRFISETWRNIIDKSYWEDARLEAKENIDKSHDTFIFASDIDPDAIEIAKQNAKNAGVDKKIRFSVCDCKNVRPFKEKGVIVCNPPYGERLLDIKQCQGLYRMMGKKFDEFKEAKKYILTSYEDFEKYYGKNADKKRKVYNGMLKCNIYQYFK
ncbi:MAG: class I SAM-dependent RNA methyltransferase [Ruminococcaceae bacterium]|nr:class I SAM-dependent RNA methyltransferase [Oscillospiraceae bacterium]